MQNLVCKYLKLCLERFCEKSLEINMLILIIFFPDMREPRIAAEIAKELHRFHQVDIPGSKEPQLWNDIFKFLKKGSWPKLLF